MANLPDQSDEKKPVVIQAQPAGVGVQAMPATVVMSGKARSVSGGRGTLTVRGPGVTEVRQDIVTEYRASDGLSWVVIENRIDDVTYIDLVNLTP